MVARQQLGGTVGVSISLAVEPAFQRGLSRLVAVLFGDVLIHELFALVIQQDSPLAAHSFGHQDAPDAGRPDHPRRVKLDELHVLQLGAGVVGERVAVAGILPAIAGDLVRFADPARRQHHRLGAEDDESSSVPVIRERPRHAVAVLDQPDHGTLHVHFDPLMDAMIL